MRFLHAQSLVHAKICRYVREVTSTATPKNKQLEIATRLEDIPILVMRTDCEIYLRNRQSDNEYYLISVLYVNAVIS